MRERYKWIILIQRDKQQHEICPRVYGPDEKGRFAHSRTTDLQLCSRDILCILNIIESSEELLFMWGTFINVYFRGN